ncbi:hypothetical protein MPLA_2090005 [Mesorhizobium sp. ORS 3359]|nr:hypothetical protein MPLA_2090005 [Mesorhizobium sp. ORS 3359]
MGGLLALREGAARAATATC